MTPMTPEFIEAQRPGFEAFIGFSELSPSARRMYRDNDGTPQYYTKAIRDNFAGWLAAKADSADQLDAEANMTPCEEDARVVRDCAMLIRAGFSYEEAERMSAPPARQVSDEAT